MLVGCISSFDNLPELPQFDLLEIRLDLFQGDPVETAKKARSIFSAPLLFTLRGQSGKEALLTEIAKLQPEWIDLEWGVSADIPAGVKVVRSYHGTQIPKQLCTQKADHFKIVLQDGSVQDAITLITRFPNSSRLTSFCMTKKLQFTRFLASWRYIPVGASVASGQRKNYYCKIPGSNTKIFALLGNPVKQSPSPITHNAVFEKLGLDAIYITIPCSTADVAELLKGPFSGFSITMPHKHAFGKAPINTLSKEGVIWEKSNTDGAGAQAALGYPKHKHVHLIGMGGTARAIKMVLEKDNKVTWSSRSNPDKARNIETCEILINCSPVGMDRKKSPIRDDQLQNQQVIFDCVMGLTPLLEKGRERGILTISGYKLFINQACLQMSTWFPGIDKSEAQKIMESKMSDGSPELVDQPYLQTCSLRMNQ